MISDEFYLFSSESIRIRIHNSCFILAAYRFFNPVLRLRIQDPVAFWRRDPGWVKKSRSGFGMNIPDHISESLEPIFWIQIIIKFADADADSGSVIFLTLDPG
jgi:hypothetical protein